MSISSTAISVIVLAYQGAKYLPATIDSILQQGYANLEIVVFGDDDCRTIRWFGLQSHPQIKLILQNNSGLANTLNQGILATTGEYIAFVNAGDLWQPNRLCKQLACLERHAEVGLVHSWSVLVDRQGKSRGKVLKQPPTIGLEVASPAQTSTTTALNLARLKNDLTTKPEILARNHINLASVTVRRSCFETVGLFNSAVKIVPDWEMWVRLSLRYQFMAIAEPLVCCWQDVEHSRENWSLAETDLQTIIESAYGLLDAELEPQKHKSYGYASLFLADMVLQDRDPDLAVVNNYCYQALQHDSALVFSFELCRLRWAILILHCLQNNRYLYLKQLAKSTVGNLQYLAANITKQSQSLVDWMLEEEDSFSFVARRNRKAK